MLKTNRTTRSIDSRKEAQVLYGSSSRLLLLFKPLASRWESADEAGITLEISDVSLATVGGKKN